MGACSHPELQVQMCTQIYPILKHTNLKTHLQFFWYIWDLNTHSGILVNTSSFISGYDQVYTWVHPDLQVLKF